MTALVACETVLLVLLVVLVAGLLRSHAEILRRLGPPEGEAARRPAPFEGATAAGERRVRDLAGVTPAGDGVQISLASGGAPVLLAFLSSGCASCEPFWRGLGDAARGGELPAGARAVAITHGPERESPAQIAALAGDGVQVVMSQHAFEDYGVTVTPYMVFIDGDSGRVIGEGTAAGWPQLLALMRDALADLDGAAMAAAQGAAKRPGAGSHGGTGGALAAAGIGPGHPSLYPSRGEAKRR